MNKPITSPKSIYHCLQKITMVLLFCFSTFSLFAQPSFCISSTSGSGNVTVDVTVENFTDIVAIQFPIAWDPNVLQLNSVSNFGLSGLTSPGNFGLTQIPDGLLRFLWLDPMQQTGTSLPNGSIIFSINFTVLTNGSTDVAIFDNAPAMVIEVVDVNLNVYGVADVITKVGTVQGIGVMLTGNLFNDLNSDCIKDIGEDGYKDWILEIEDSNNEKLYLNTNPDGSYSILLEEGNHTITPKLPNSYWQLCQTTFEADFSNGITNLEIDIPAQVLVECPVMQVDLSTVMLRRCFENKYTINYCNIGTADATDAYVDVELDEFLSVVSSTLPITAQNGNIYTFDIGDVGMSGCGSFDLQVLVSCDADLGVTHCSEAHIYPDEICESPAGWSGASLEIVGVCNSANGMIEFTITNIGNDDMQNGTSSIVIEDAVMLLTNFNIPALTVGQSHTISVPSDGTTIRMEIDQIPNHPGESRPSAVVEGCGTNSTGGSSTGFVNQFPQDEENTFISIDCRENIGAFDPNDKQAFPRGYGNLNYLKANTDIEYLIRFQNTGTDTAFNIVIRDTLSEFLDVASIRLGASSHSVDFEVVGEGIAVFYFNNIMLPDSNINEPASHGFVQFKIEQELDLPDETLIENDAAIFFDFNEPIITNTVFHTIGENFITVNTREIFSPDITVHTFPNPFQDVVQFEVKGDDFHSIELNIYDLTGRLIRTATHPNSTFSFYRKNLTSGIYMYKLSGDGQPISSGKIIVE